MVRAAAQAGARCRAFGIRAVLRLLRVAMAEDLRVAEQALSLITQRGCNRGRDPMAMFTRLRAELTA